MARHQLGLRAWFISTRWRCAPYQADHRLLPRSTFVSGAIYVQVHRLAGSSELFADSSAWPVKPALFNEFPSPSKTVLDQYRPLLSDKVRRRHFHTD